MSDTSLTIAQPVHEEILQIFALLEPPVTSFCHLTSTGYSFHFDPSLGQMQLHIILLFSLITFTFIQLLYDDLWEEKNCKRTVQIRGKSRRSPSSLQCYWWSLLRLHKDAQGPLILGM